MNDSMCLRAVGYQRPTLRGLEAPHGRLPTTPLIISEAEMRDANLGSRYAKGAPPGAGSASAGVGLVPETH